MSLYNLGLAVPTRSSSPYVEGVAVGALVVTPGAIKDEAIALNADVETLAAEVSRSRGLGADGRPLPVSADQEAWFQGTWTPFFVAWRHWFEDHGATWGLRNVVENFWGSTWEEAQDWRKKLIDVRKSARDVGIILLSPEPAKPKVGWLDQLGSDLRTLIKTILWVVVIGGGVWVLLKLGGRL